MNKGTREGTREEIFLVKELNSKKKSILWKKLLNGKNQDNLFAVHVTTHQLSIIINKRVKPKADIYLAQGMIPYEYVNGKNYYLCETDVNKYMLRKVAFSGISVKRKGSLRYQILKMRPITFKKVFGTHELGAGASIYCTRESDLDKNTKVLKGWDTNWNNFEKFYCFIEGIELLRSIHTAPASRLQIARKIKKYSNIKIKDIIQKNIKISDFVFKGIGNFNEPYTAFWFYENRVLKKAGPIPFIITTGSGRSHGDFTVVVKPL